MIIDHATSAFPLPTGAADLARQGLSMRDYFAAAALPALLVNGYVITVAVAKAYQIADEMMVVRGR